MSYHFSTTLSCSFEEADERIRAVLTEEKFGILSTIDVDEKFREKLQKEFRRYRILGACSPAHAYRALQEEDKIGTMLPCNVILQEHAPNQIEVSAVDPVSSMRSVGNPALASIAGEVQAILRKVIGRLAVDA